MVVEEILPFILVIILLVEEEKKTEFVKESLTICNIVEEDKSDEDGTTIVEVEIVFGSKR